MIVESIHNGVEGDDNEDDFENEEDELVQEQLESLQSEKQPALSTKRKRGPTMMHGVQVREFNERETIICNEFAQPIGPETKEKDIVGKFSRFLGTIARNYNYAPLTYSSWRKVPLKEKDKMWEFVLEKHDVPDAAKNWVLRSIGASWRGYKCRIKKKHYYKFKDNKTRWKNRPNSIPQRIYYPCYLLSSWNKKDVMEQCIFKRNARKAQKNMHTAGPKSFARIRAVLMNANPNKEPPSLTQMFERTRRRTNGNVYLDSYDDTAKKIEQMKNYQPSENGSVVVDPFLAVMNKEYDGHCRLYGKGVTKKLLKNVNDGDTSYMVPGNIMESVKASLEVEKKQLVDMRKELEEHERKKAELEEEHERKKAELEEIRKDIENQRETLVEDALQKLMKKLPAGVFKTF